MEKHWRLILSESRGAAFNMAVDEAILRTCTDGEVPPTLRLYGWEKPSVSLGYSQDIERIQIDVQYCRDAGVELVRRLTGGRAVLHGHDLTFSVAVQKHDIQEGFGDVRRSHLWLMGGVRAGLRTLGINAEIGSSGERSLGAATSADCFAHIAECDIRAGTSKLVGSAQVRRWGGILEQGSIPHLVPPTDYQQVFAKANSHWRPDRSFPSGVSRQTIEEAIVQGFEQTLEVDFEVGTLTDREIGLAFELERNKYASPDWTYRRHSIYVDKRMQGCYTDNVNLRGGRHHAEENPGR